MRISLFLTFLLGCLSATAFAQNDVPNSTYYFGDTIDFNGDIPYPLAEYGHEVGEWHVRHDQIYAYMQQLDAASPRMKWQNYGASYEKRLLGMMVVTSPANHARLEEIRLAHLESLKSGKVDESLPTIIYQGYTVHGDESSGANAALLYAYYLAAAKGQEIDDKLEHCIILLDPCFNPDGLDRFAHWANTNKGKNPVADGQAREHNQPWLSGRTNHYWFDLNRDWLPLQHPESQGRAKVFHNWKPNILTDHHEMGTHSTFFFQPGVPSRTNPITPAANQEMTGRIAEFHANRLDRAGSLYYTRESYDDFYYGKGSTYPDANGCIGILFEQASARGHVQETEASHTDLTFPFSIRNQLMTSFSTLEAGFTLRKDLRNYQVKFFNDARSDAKSDRKKYLVFGDEHDAQRAAYLAESIQRHDIQIYRLGKALKKDGNTYPANQSFIVPMEQDQYRLIQAILQERTEFNDSLFYDISAWTLPYAFHVKHTFLSTGEFQKEMLGSTETDLSDLTIKMQESEYAYLIPWDDYMAPAFLYAMLDQGIHIKVADATFSAVTFDGVKAFERGTLLLPIQGQPYDSAEMFKFIAGVNQNYRLQISAVKTGLTPEGMDLGSNNFKPVQKPNVLLIVGDGVNPYDAGEVWHLLDYRFDIPVTTIETSRIGGVDLSKYNVIAMVDGGYSELSGSGNGALKNWVKDGGTLIAMRSAVSWAKSNGLCNVGFKKKDDPYEISEVNDYSHLGSARGAQVIGGAIVEVNADLTHPLLYGYHDESFPIFQRGTQFIEPLDRSWAAPLHYSKKPLLSGYISNQNQDLLAKSPALVIGGSGSGKVVCFNFNPNFRAFWYGTNKLFLNAVFFGDQIRWDAVDR